ncbi:hypothetical protein F5887DRAFT_963309 [Amanita rubescens]|nr:hypothetical protein F5887DRAFT_963309 [Amanita rubescens]
MARGDAAHFFRLILTHKLVFLCLFYVFALAIGALARLNISISQGYQKIDEVAWYNITQDVFLHRLDRFAVNERGA